MYTAKITNKETKNGELTVTVEFSNGTTTVTESCIPQNEAGFKFWVKSRLETFNSGETIDAAYQTGQAVDLSGPTPPTPTQAQLDEQAWFADYQTLQNVQKLVDLGVLTGTETKVIALRDKVKLNFKPTYFNLI